MFYGIKLRAQLKILSHASLKVNVVKNWLEFGKSIMVISWWEICVRKIKVKKVNFLFLSQFSTLILMNLTKRLTSLDSSNSQL